MNGFKKSITLGLCLILLLGISLPTKVNAATIINPQFGPFLKKAVARGQVKAIDSVDGWWLIAEAGKLGWISGDKTSYWQGKQTGFPQLLSADVDVNVYEAQVVYNYKKGQEIQVLPSVEGWWQVKTPEGYLGWVNAAQTSYNNKGVLVADQDLPAYFIGKLAPKQKIKDVQAGEQVKAIDSREGWWLIAEAGKLGWISGGKTSYWQGKQTGFPQLLSADSKQEVYEAGADYVYSKGEKITVVEGSVEGWWKVRTPNGYNAWVNAGLTSYNSNRELIADTSVKAYFTGRGSNNTQTQSDKVIAEAKKHLGKPYVYGATGPNSFDCSGLTQYVYRTALGIDITRTTYTQVNQGIAISASELKPGDLVFTNADHVQLYIGNGQVIHAPQPGDVVKISPLTTVWKARRILN